MTDTYRLVLETARMIFNDFRTNAHTVNHVPAVVIPIDDHGLVEGIDDIEHLPKEVRPLLQERIAHVSGACFQLFECWMYTGAPDKPLPDGPVRNIPGRVDALMGFLLFRDGQMVSFTQALTLARHPEGDTTEMVIDTSNRVEGPMAPRHKPVERV